MGRRPSFLRARSVAASALFVFVAACGFGVDLDGIFGGGGVGPNDDGGSEGGDANNATDSAIPKVPVVQLGVGDEFGCGRREDGTVMCWGGGWDGRLGDNLEVSSSRPVLVKDLNDAIDLSVGDDHACAVKKNNTVVCWGENNGRQLGDGSQNKALLPRAVPGLTDVTHVAAGGEFTCALKTDGTVQCWGDNAYGQLGDNTKNFRGSPAPVTGLTDVTQIAASFYGACALVKAGDVYCWGDNGEGLSGLGTTGNPTLVPTKVPTLTGVASIGHGPSAYHFCAVLQAGGAKCWGDANAGQIGDAMNVENKPAPEGVVGLTDASKIAMGDSFTCAVRKTGEVSCWGSNSWRQIGQGDNDPPGGTNVPVAVAGLTDVEQIAAGNDFVCALHTGGNRIDCWGANRAGSLGRDTRVASETPLKLAGIPPASKVGMGRNHSCLVTQAGAIWCWGFNEYRQQADSKFTATGTPTEVTAISGAQKIIGGELHTCGIFGTDVKCWGHNDHGALGNGQGNYIQTDPVQFITNGPATEVNAGYQFTCVILANKQLLCAGLNEEGRVGVGSGAGYEVTTPMTVMIPNPDFGDAGADADPDADAGPPPPQFIPMTDVASIGVGRVHSCAVHGGGKVSCWGTPWDGRLGINTNTARDIPIPAKSINDLGIGATAAAAGFDHSCAILVDGSVRCWGANYNGQLSGGGDNGASLRTPNLNGKKAKAITAGGSHTCVILEDDTASCWGNGRDGQLGQGMRASASQPVAVSGLTGIVSLDAEEDRTCAVTNDGSVYCWGSNWAGLLGDGVVVHTGVPGPVFGY